MKTVAIIQARLGSSRLPGKVFCDIGGQPMLARVYERVAKCQNVDQVVIATTTHQNDRLIVDFCEQNQWPCFAGSQEDVLNRYVNAARQFQADRIVRITSDCPLIDAGIVDQVVQQMDLDSTAEYAANFFPRRWYPRGLDAEIVARDTLEHVDRVATLPSHREHVTLYIYRNPEHFRMAAVCCRQDYSQFRWTVDTQDDLILVRKIYQYFENQDFAWMDVLAAFRERLEWFEVNRNIAQKVA